MLWVQWQVKPQSLISHWVMPWEKKNLPDLAGGCFKCWNYLWIHPASQGRFLSSQNPAWAGCSHSLQTKQGTEQNSGFLGGSVIFDISPVGFFCWVTYGNSEVLGAIFLFFHFLFSLINGKKAAPCFQLKWESWKFPGLNNQPWKHLEIPWIYQPPLQSIQFGIPGWSMGGMDPTSWEFRSCKLNSNQSFSAF